ncbi:hypothetical protein GCM10023169_23030 [Georgenia halophila]|uniref:DUF4190 domain-containing protein n=1 Tax=Georgenia halophila TaxID=620889 RepID=A0ABP8LBP4_9MICO
MSTGTAGDGDRPGVAGQRREPENPFAAPSSPRPPTDPYGSYGAAPTHDHRQPADPRQLGPPGTDPARPGQEPFLFPGTEHGGAPAVLDGPGYTTQEPANHPLAVAAIVLGVLSVVPGIGIAAVVCGHVALQRLRTGYYGGRGLATAGLVLGYALTVLWALLALAL